MQYPLWGQRFRAKFALIFNRKPLINYLTMYGGVLQALVDFVECVFLD
jgi:hypothetical protein